MTNGQQMRPTLGDQSDPGQPTPAPADRALAYAVYAVVGLAVVVALRAAWVVSPWLVVLLAAAPAGVVLIAWRLRVASRRLDRAITEETTRDGGVAAAHAACDRAARTMAQRDVPEVTG